MNRNHEIPVRMSDVYKRIDLNVRLTGVRRANLRIRLGLWVVWLGTRIAGIGLHVEDDHDDLTHDDLGAPDAA